jgi:hypothetical protein
MGAGLAIASGSVAVTLLIGLYLAATIGAAIRSEERDLTERFGVAYERYRRADRSNPESCASTRSFSLVQAIANKEYRAVAGVVLAVLLLALKAAYNAAFWRQPGG